MSPNILPRNNQREILLVNLCSLFIWSRYIGTTVLSLIIRQKHLPTMLPDHLGVTMGNVPPKLSTSWCHWVLDYTSWHYTQEGHLARLNFRINHCSRLQQQPTSPDSGGKLLLNGECVHAQKSSRCISIDPLANLLPHCTYPNVTVKYNCKNHWVGIYIPSNQIKSYCRK